MIRIVLVLSLLKLAIPSKIPIHKQIVGPGGENIDVNIQLNIEVPDDDTTGEVYPISTPAPREKCSKDGDVCSTSESLSECCDGLSCVESGYKVDPPLYFCKNASTPTDEPTCLKTGEACTPSERTKCCPTNLCDLDNLKCVRVQNKKV